jgi:hypothetical protein
MDTLKDGEMNAICKSYKLSGTVKVKFNEKEFAKNHPKTYDKFCEESVTYSLRKIKVEEGED